MTTTYGLTSEHAALITALHDKISAQAVLLNQASVNGHRVGGPRLVDENFADIAAMLTNKAAGKPLPSLPHGRLGTLYLAHANSPYHVLPAQALHYQTLVLSLWDVSNLGTEDNPSLQMEPHKTAEAIRIEFHPAEDIAAIRQDLADGYELELGKFKMSDAGACDKIMKCVGTRLGRKRLTAVSKQVLHPPVNQLGQNPPADADPNKDNLPQRRQVFNTLLMHFKNTFKPLEDLVRDENDRHFQKPMHIYNVDATNLMRFSGTGPALTGIRSLYLTRIFNPQTGEPELDTIYRLSNGAPEAIASRRASWEPSFHRDQATGESFYPWVKEITDTLKMRASVTYEM